MNHGHIDANSLIGQAAGNALVSALSAAPRQEKRELYTPKEGEMVDMDRMRQNYLDMEAANAGPLPDYLSGDYVDRMRGIAHDMGFDTTENFEARLSQNYSNVKQATEEANAQAATNSSMQTAISNPVIDKAQYRDFALTIANDKTLTPEMKAYYIQTVGGYVKPDPVLSSETKFGGTAANQINTSNQIYSQDEFRKYVDPSVYAENYIDIDREQYNRPETLEEKQQLVKTITTSMAIATPIQPEVMVPLDFAASAVGSLWVSASNPENKPTDVAIDVTKDMAADLVAGKLVGHVVSPFESYMPNGASHIVEHFGTTYVTDNAASWYKSSVDWINNYLIKPVSDWYAGKTDDGKK